jgi:hypothetical protein
MTHGWTLRIAIVTAVLAAAARPALALSPPTNLSAHTMSSAAITLDWASSDSTVTGFEIERSLNAENGFKTVAQFGSGTRTYLNGGLSGSTTYYYRMRALAGSKLSTRTSAVSARTLAPGALPTATRTALATPTAKTTPTPTRTTTPVPTTTKTSTPVSTITSTPASTRTATATAAATRTATPQRTATAIRTATTTPRPTATLTRTAAPTPVPTSAGGTMGQPEWAFAHGGTGADVSKAVAVDDDGNSVIVGNFTGTANFGIGALTSAGAGDVFIAKYGSDDMPQWARRYGGAGNDTAYAVAIDRSANCDGTGGSNCIVVAGNFNAVIDLGTGPLVSAGGADIFVAKYASSGTPLWAHRYGGASDESGYGVAVDAGGNVFLTGFFMGSTDFGGGALYSPYMDEDTFVLKLSRAGAYLWARNFSNTSRDIGQAVALTAAGDVVIAGYNLGAFEGVQSRGKEDIFVVRLAGGTGAKLWSQRFGGSTSDQAFGVAVDSADDIVVTGSFQGNVDFGGGALTATGQDIFLLELTGAGAYRWAKHFGGTLDFVNSGLAVATDSAANVIVTGELKGTADFGTGLLASTNGTADAFVAKYTAAGSPLWAKRFGSNGTEYASALAIDPLGDDVVLTGSFDFSINVGTGALASGGSYDVFVARFTP